MPLTSIKHIAARCGGGKSVHTVKELHSFIERKNLNRLYLFASKTKALSRQNFDRFSQLVTSSGSNINHSLIDSDENRNVANAISQFIIQNQTGVLFVTHHSLNVIEPQSLQGASLFCDEVPGDLIKMIRVQSEDKDSGNRWEQFVVHQQSSLHSNFKVVELAPNASRDDVSRLISNIRNRLDNTISPDVAALLQYLLDGHEVLYSTVRNDDGKAFNLYLGVDWSRIEDLAKCIDEFVVLSAQLEFTLFGFIAKFIAGLTIEELTITDQLTLEKKHKHRARIYPLIHEGNWSTYLKRKIASEAIVDNNHAIEPGDTVLDHMQKVIEGAMGGHHFLLFKNNKDDLHPCLVKPNVQPLSISVHGLNSYSLIHHAAYLGAANPDPNEKSILQMLAKDHGLDPNTILDYVVTERNYESAYQAISRTSVRDNKTIPDFEHIFIVPDSKHANYIEQWFHTGCATIDYSLACKRIPTPRKRKKSDDELNMMIRILTENQLEGTLIKDLISREGISTPTYKRYRKKHGAELKRRGLI